MSGRVFVEAFGRFLTGGYPDEEDLFSVFRARSVLMGWYTPPHGRAFRPPGLWMMHEADFAEERDAPRIGSAQVGLEAGVPFVIALPALIQCFENSLRQFGTVELSGYQVTTENLEPRRESYVTHLVEVLNWFDVSPQSAEAVVEVCGVGRDAGPAVVAELVRRNTGTFKFEAGASSLDWGAPTEMSSLQATDSPGVSLKVTFPNGPTAAGWVLATATDAVRTLRAGITDIRVSLAYARVLGSC